MEYPQRPFLIEVKCGHGRPEAFASPSRVSSTEKCLEADDLIPQLAVAFHDLALLLSQPPTSLPISSIAFAAKP